MADAKRICAVEGCGKPHSARGWCRTHYFRWFKHGSPSPALSRRSPGEGSGICSVDGCGARGRITRGWCDKHYQRWRKSGDVSLALINRDQTGKPCRADGCENPSGHFGYCVKHYRRLKTHGSLADPTGHRRRQVWIEENRGHSEEACLYWPFSVNKTGRGTVSRGGKSLSASRAMCIAAHGEPPTPEHQAAHTCGKGHEGCVNPRHLRWATARENEADKIAHGTQRKGSDVNTSKLTADDVRLIRSSVGSGPTLSKLYGVSRSTISAVRRRKSWAWLD